MQVHNSHHISFFYFSAIIAIHGYEAIKEALVTQGQQFSGRQSITGNARYMASPTYPNMGMAELDKLTTLMRRLDMEMLFASPAQWECNQSFYVVILTSGVCYN